jgi:integrase
MLGHANRAITVRMYGHVLLQMHEAAAAMMDAVFAKRA